MESIQPNTHSFVVKVWSEETGAASPAVVWRGQITHVPSGEQRSIHELAEIASVCDAVSTTAGREATAGGGGCGSGCRDNGEKDAPADVPTDAGENGGCYSGPHWDACGSLQNFGLTMQTRHKAWLT